MKRLTQSLFIVLFSLFAFAATASAQLMDDVCKEGSWQEFRFKSQGQCIKLVGSGEVPVWSLHRDYLLYPENQNPSPDQYGNADVWHYRYSVSSGRNPAAYVYYSDYIVDWSGIREAWTAGTVNESYSPLLGVRPEDSGAVLHPYEFSTVASWRSPIDGWVGVRGYFRDPQGGCGDGVTWAIDHETTTKTTERDQGQIFGTGGEVELGTDTWSQSITAGIPGQLAGIQFQIHYGPLPGTFIFSLLGGGSPPDGPVLYSEEVFIGLDDVDDDSVYMWDVTDANLFFGANDAFTFVLSAEEFGFNIAGNHSPGYDFGDLFKNGSGPVAEPSDIAFISYVKTAPEEQVVATLAQGTVKRPPTEFSHLFNFGFRMPVATGDFLDFIVDPGPTADSSCDTTWVEILIVGSPPRD